MEGQEGHEGQEGQEGQEGHVHKLGFLLAVDLSESRILWSLLVLLKTLVVVPAFTA